MRSLRIVVSHTSTGVGGAFVLTSAFATTFAGTVDWLSGGTYLPWPLKLLTNPIADIILKSVLIFIGAIVWWRDHRANKIVYEIVEPPSEGPPK